MGSKPSAFRKGSGFLNNVDATLTGLEFSDTFRGEAQDETRFQWIYANVTFDVDGKDKPESITMKVAGLEDFNILSPTELEPTKPGNELSANIDFARLVTSLTEQEGFDVDRLYDDRHEFAGIIGARGRLKQVPDTDAMARIVRERAKPGGKKKYAKYNDQGQKLSKDGKYYNLTYLAFDEFYGIEEVDAPAPSKSKPAARTTTRAAGKPNGKAVEVDIDETAVEIVQNIVANAKNGQIKKASARLAVIRALSDDTETRDAVVAWLQNDDNLENVEGVSYDRSSGVLSVA